MKLHYKIRKEIDPAFTNFGDDLNLWLWPRLIGDLLDNDDRVVFVGMGTVLTTGLKEGGAKVICGAGTGYGSRLRALPENWQVYFVRGPFTADTLGLSRQLAITDPAVLIRAFVRDRSQRLSGAFMPHVTSVWCGDWESACRDVGLRFINPSWPVERTIDEIAESEWLITEAMHGAIVADALRVPWKACLVSSGLCEFKWHDWTESLGLQFRPLRISPLWDKTAHPISPLGQIRRWTKRRIVRAQLRKIVNRGTFELSKESKLAGLIDRIHSRLKDFRADCLAGNLLASARRIPTGISAA